MEPVERIPYNQWAYSQLSLARHYGEIKINGKHYVLDFDSCKKELDEDGEERYFPDLVLQKEN